MEEHGVPGRVPVCSGRTDAGVRSERESDDGVVGNGEPGSCDEFMVAVDQDCASRVQASALQLSTDLVPDDQFATISTTRRLIAPPPAG